MKNSMQEMQLKLSKEQAIASATRAFSMAKNSLIFEKAKKNYL